MCKSCRTCFKFYCTFYFILLVIAPSLRISSLSFVQIAGHREQAAWWVAGGGDFFLSLDLYIPARWRPFVVVVNWRRQKVALFGGADTRAGCWVFGVCQWVWQTGRARKMCRLRTFVATHQETPNSFVSLCVQRQQQQQKLVATLHG